MTMQPPESKGPRARGQAPGSHRSRRGIRFAVIGICAVAAAGVIAFAVNRVTAPISASTPVAGPAAIGTFSHHHVVIRLPARPDSYLGAFVKGVPGSYQPVRSFTTRTGVHPNLALYYSGWYEKFHSAFAIQAADNGTVPFIQINPTDISLKAIAAGAFDTYLERFATAVASFGATTGRGVIIGFGHEMNGHWFSWGYRHASPTSFIAAWRHIVTVFRQQGADDVTWLWTVNIIDSRGGILSPARWWPGSSYVTWVGIDGYYYKPSWTFASLFGPTIKAVKALTLDPILISETSAAPAAGQPAKIANLYAGVRDYGLLGFVWFDADHVLDWRLQGQPALAAFRRGATTFTRPAS